MTTLANVAVNEIKEALTDNVKRNSALSECYGFVNSLKYNPARKITDAQINTILALFPKKLLGPDHYRY